MLIITVPMALLLLMLSNESYYIFYGSSKYGSLALKVSAISHIFFGVWTVINTSLQSMRKFKIDYINSVAGLLANALLDIPLILLFNKVGLPEYIATIVSTCIGYSISISIALIYLRKEMHFSYRKTIDLMKKLIVPSIAIIVPILLSKTFIKFDYTFISSAISLMIHGILGVIIYLTIVYKNNAINETLGNEFIDKILVKLRLKKV